MYRPQFFCTTPKGFIDELYVRPVTYGQDPSGNIITGQTYQNYTVQLDEDADQIYRSLFIQGLQQGLTLPLQIQMRDAYGNYITDGYIPLALYAWGAGSTTPDGGSGRAKVFEPEMYCPAGSVLLVDFFNPDVATYQFPGLMEFRGVKRRCVEVCA